MKTKFERQRSQRAQFAPQSATIFKQQMSPPPPSLTTCHPTPRTLDSFSLHWMNYHCSWSGFLAQFLVPQISPSSRQLFCCHCFGLFSRYFFSLLFPSPLIPATRFYHTAFSPRYFKSYLQKEYQTSLSEGFKQILLPTSSPWSLVSPTYLCLPYS